MKLMFLTAALIAAPVFAQAQNDTSITTRSSTSKSAGKVMHRPRPTAKDAMQPNDTSITTRSGIGDTPNGADQAGMAAGGMNSGGMSAPPAGAMTQTYPTCSRTVTDQCIERRGRR